MLSWPLNDAASRELLYSLLRCWVLLHAMDRHYSVSFGTGDSYPTLRNIASWIPDTTNLSHCGFIPKVSYEEECLLKE
jgi:hypothetical protein